MKNTHIPCFLFFVFVWFLFTTPIAAATAEYLPIMRISVENAQTHVQTRTVQQFAEDLKNKLKGKINVKFFSNASLFRDKDVVQALGQGKVEMAVPGTWQVAQFEPNVGVFLLPVFYGRSSQFNHGILDSKIGKTVDDLIEKNLQLKVAGRWIDLGHAHLFSITKKITSHGDIKNLKVRVAGGMGNKLRIKAFGGIPVAIAWPDLPEYIVQHRVDAILTSYETIRSAKLWEKGIKYVFEDQEYFPQYIPLIRMSFWKKLSPDIQDVVIATWDKYVDPSRKDAANAQVMAKKILIKNGVKVVVPGEQEVKKWRARIIKNQNQFVQIMNIDTQIVDLIKDLE